MSRSPLASSERGMTLYEVLIGLLATMAIVAVLAPSLGATLAHARETRAITDMEAIRDAINNFLADGFTRFTDNGTQTVSRRMTLLVGNGDIPAAGSTSDWTSTTTPADVDFLEEHLVLNSFNGGNSYATAFSPTWRGAYVTPPVDPDPWGNRYGVNVQWLGGGMGGSNDVVVHSAGPDETVDTVHADNPLVAGGDDLIVLVEA